jgi:hypothetical protein
MSTITIPLVLASDFSGLWQGLWAIQFLSFATCMWVCWRLAFVVTSQALVASVLGLFFGALDILIAYGVKRSIGALGLLGLVSAIQASVILLASLANITRAILGGISSETKR